MKKFISLLSLVGITLSATAQTLSPGFDKSEYLEVLSMASNLENMRVDTIYKCPLPTRFHKIYVSPEVGFDNEWELWKDDNSGLLAIMLRATVTTEKSWMSNFNAGMVRARGICHAGRDISYDFCQDSLACVHAGWTAGLLTITDDIRQKVDSCYAAGNRDFIIGGHSQGGALCFLLTAYLRRAQINGSLPTDIRFKTYASAAPKPGDYLFALHYEALTQGWAFNVVNADDWVPEVPLSVQRPTDMRPTNPFAQIDALTDEMGTKAKIEVKFLYNKLNKPTSKSVDNLTKYLGETIGERLADKEEWFSQPTYADCANYARAGHTYVLMPDDAYHATHPHESNDAFEHHMYKAYYELATRLLK